MNYILNTFFPVGLNRPSSVKDLNESTDVLLKLLKSGENAWQFEKDGNKRSEHIDFYSVYSEKLATYHHGIIKGKWLPQTKNILLRKGYKLEGNKFKTYSHWDEFFINFYSFIFFKLNRFLHFFKSS